MRAPTSARWPMASMHTMGVFKSSFSGPSSDSPTDSSAVLFCHEAPPATPMAFVI